MHNKIFINPYIFFILILIIQTSCISNNEIKENKNLADKLLIEIENKYKDQDVEKQIEEFKKSVIKSGVTISDFVLSNGNELSEDMLEKMKKEGWMNELKTQINNLIDKINENDFENTKRYIEIIKIYADKIGYNLFQTLSIITEYIEKKSVDFSKSELFQKLAKIWSNQ